jgi:heat shock protein HslJ
MISYIFLIRLVDTVDRGFGFGINECQTLGESEKMLRTFSVLFIGMVTVSCAAGPLTSENTRNTDHQMVFNITWQWVSTITPVEKIAVPNPERYTIFLTADGKAKIRFDCNRGGGDYKISKGKLSFGPLLSTRMACPPDTLDGPFMRDLQRVASFFVENGNLYLELPFDSGTMKFRPAP